MRALTGGEGAGCWAWATLTAASRGAKTTK
jgi:hypothetical protein